MLPVVQIGRFALQLPGLLLILGVWLGLSQAETAARRRGLPVDALTAVVGLSLLFGLLAARLGYVLVNLPAYIPRPFDAFTLTPSALDGWSGIVGGAAAALILATRRRLPLPLLLDALAPGLAAFSVFLGLSHLASGAAFGAETELPWAIRLWGTLRHPTQAYEAVAGLLAFTLVRRRADPVPGQTFLLWLGAAGFSVLVIEGFCGDSLLGPWGIRVRQVPALLLGLGSLWRFGTLARGASTAGASSAPMSQEGASHA
jgi:phosphatidylglycerol---prolipoprotein diacylglyceryl transferase